MTVVAIGQSVRENRVPTVRGGGVTTSLPSVRYSAIADSRTSMEGEPMALFSRDDDKQPLSTHTPADPEITPVEREAVVPLGPPVAESTEIESAEIDIDARLKVIARKIVGTKKKLVANVLSIGELLSDAQDLLASSSGGAFGKWIKQRCGYSRVTAYKYIAVHRVFGGCKPGLQRQFDTSAMYALSLDNVPPAAVADSLKLAESGETITGKVAKQLITMHTVDSEARTVSTKPDLIFFEDPEAIVTIQPRKDGVDPYNVLARILKKMIEERKAIEANREAA